MRTTLALMLLVAGCRGTTTADMAALRDLAAPPDLLGSHTVIVTPNGQLVFDPATLIIPVGDTVRWIWGASGHTVTSGTPPTPDNKFCSPDDMSCAGGVTSSLGAVYDHKFTTPGSYPYFCLPHGFSGTITAQ